jgi:hypothetical protein
MSSWFGSVISTEKRITGVSRPWMKIAKGYHYHVEKGQTDRAEDFGGQSARVRAQVLLWSLNSSPFAHPGQANEQRISLITNQRTVLSVIIFQPSEQGMLCFSVSGVLSTDGVIWNAWDAWWRHDCLSLCVWPLQTPEEVTVFSSSTLLCWDFLLTHSLIKPLSLFSFSVLF